jgi:hypothetical protein
VICDLVHHFSNAPFTILKGPGGGGSSTLNSQNGILGKAGRVQIEPFTGQAQSANRSGEDEKSPCTVGPDAEGGATVDCKLVA